MDTRKYMYQELKSLFSRWFGEPPVPENARTFLALLDNYPEFPLPAKGHHLTLSHEAAQRNLEAVMQAMPDRLAALESLCYAFSIDWPDQLSLNESRELIKAIHSWAGETWPHVYKDLPDDAEAQWFAGERAGEYKILSVISDITLLLGTIIIHERPGIRWGIDDDQDNLKDRMGTPNRVVLLAPWMGDPETLSPIDVEFVVLGRLVEGHYINERFENSWLRVVEGACVGGYEGVGVIDPP